VDGFQNSGSLTPSSPILPWTSLDSLDYLDYKIKQMNRSRPRQDGIQTCAGVRMLHCFDSFVYCRVAVRYLNYCIYSGRSRFGRRDLRCRLLRMYSVGFRVTIVPGPTFSPTSKHTFSIGQPGGGFSDEAALARDATDPEIMKSKDEIIAVTHDTSFLTDAPSRVARRRIPRLL
jgi:hypothetical protein